MTREKGREGEGDGKVGKGRGGERVDMRFWDLSLCKTLEGHPFPFVTLESILRQNL